MRRTIPAANPGLFDYQDHVERLGTRKTALDKLNAFINWESFRPQLARAFRKQHGPDRGGRPSFDMVFMFKILVLQRIHNLSDEATELAVLERLTWHRFLGVHVGSAFPDKNTIWDFREALTRADIMHGCFQAFFLQIARHGVRLESGSLIDATIVSVPVQHTTSNSPAATQACPPESAPVVVNAAQQRQQDTDARWTTKHGKHYFGYKNHIKADQRTKLITAAVVTPANTHDSQMLAQLITAADTRLYADSAYHSHTSNELLRLLQIQDWTCSRAWRNKPLTPVQRRANCTKSRIRARIEHIFGYIKTALRGKEQRCIGYARNAARIMLTNLIYNMQRLRYLVGAV